MERIILFGGITKWQNHFLRKWAADMKSRKTQKAGITTGALYTRYKNKDELFCSLVSDVVKNLMSNSLI